MREGGLQWGLVADHLPELLEAFAVTAAVAVAAMALALVVGLVVALGALSRWRLVRVLAFTYVQVFRGVALYVLIIWVYFGLAISMQVAFDPVPAGIVTLALLNSAYLAEIFRTGIAKVDRGQLEAGDALGLTRTTTMLRVLVPQAVRAMVPAIGNQFTDVLKDTSILAVVAVPELMYSSQRLAQSNARPFEFYTFAGLLYVVAVAGITWATRRLERRLRPGSSTRARPAGVPALPGTPESDQVSTGPAAAVRLGRTALPSPAAPRARTSRA